MTSEVGPGGGLPHPGTGECFDSPVPAGSGWPGDPARGDETAARTVTDIDALSRATDLPGLAAHASVCRACPRLVAWREEVAVGKRRAYRDQPYWGRPVPSLGTDRPRVLVVGLAPAAHGGNRTGRMFTGDDSGDWIIGGLHRAGLASQAESVHAADGLTLPLTRIVAPVRCAPPDNAPTPAERDTCAHWLDAELRLVERDVRVVVALGAFAWAAVLGATRRAGRPVPRPQPRFGHGAEVALPLGGPAPATLLGSYHVSRQNTATGRLTRPMLDAVLTRAATLATPP
ncbi:uracil-DNA glycosylase [Kineococcus gynurae]|uniref:Type-5 uracil-DNA glycosylase n=1 Tax=Kineococcus gynurae TaxID=452979 RepID=A0ABV5LNL4_9ACTN